MSTPRSNPNTVPTLHPYPQVFQQMYNDNIYNMSIAVQAYTDNLTSVTIVTPFPPIPSPTGETRRSSPSSASSSSSMPAPSLNSSGTTAAGAAQRTATLTPSENSQSPTTISNSVPPQNQPNAIPKSTFPSLAQTEMAISWKVLVKEFRNSDNIQSGKFTQAQKTPSRIIRRKSVDFIIIKIFDLIT